MKHKKDINYPEYSIKDIIPDYINFILVLILGFIFHQKGRDITNFFLIQIGMLAICFFLTHFKARIISSCIIFYAAGTIFFIGLSVWLYNLLTSNFPINLVCFLSVLYANRKIFQRFQRFQRFKKDSKEFLNIFLKGFILLSCAPLLIVVPRFFKDIGFADTISFFICYTALCFPYKGTYNLLFSQQTKEKVHNFFSNPIKLFGTALMVFSLVFLFLSFYSRASEVVLISIPFLCVGIFMLLKWK